MLGRGLGAEPGGTRPRGGLFTDWLRQLRKNPAAAVVVDVAADWWNHHPLHAIGEILMETAVVAIGPVARRFPLRVVVGALIVGLVAARVRPWRWILRPALFAGLATQLLTRALTQRPLQAWLAMLAAKARQRQGEPRGEESPR